MSCLCLFLLNPDRAIIARCKNRFTSGRKRKDTTDQTLTFEIQRKHRKPQKGIGIMKYLVYRNCTCYINSTYIIQAISHATIAICENVLALIMLMLLFLSPILNPIPKINNNKQLLILEVKKIFIECRL